ncbi:uncharacterized protein [Dendrobates tinctorius]|uniref:uncharacterized protein n=2 Tax=Dendrobates tinctorius TaxID=92724 RepID=UPI003CCA6DD2
MSLFFFYCSMSSSGEEYVPGTGQEAEETSSSITPPPPEERQEQQGQVRAGRRDAPQREEDLALDNDELIRLVQERVPLWDTRHQLHSDNVVIRRLWNEVAASLMDGWDNASPRVRKDFLNKVRTRWRSMKDRFNRDIRQENKVRSGAAARTGTKYRYHRALAFLRPVLASRTTWSSTLQPGPEAVLHQAAPDPSQPSISEEAPCRSAPQSSGDQEAGRSGVPLSQVSATGFAGTSRQQRQRTLDRPLMPEFVELSSVFQSSLKALSDRLESGFLLLDQRYKSIEGRLERLEVDLARPAHHFYTQIARDTAEHLTPDLQLTVMQACNNAFMQAMQQSRIMQQSAVAFPPVPPLTRFTALPTSAAYHCTATTLPSLAGHQYTAPSPSAAGHLPANTMPSAAPAWPTTAAATTTGCSMVDRTAFVSLSVASTGNASSSSELLSE